MTLAIPDNHVQHAFDILKSSDHAQARAAYEYSEKQLKTVLAQAVLNAEAKTVGEREAIALTSDEYQMALDNFRLVAEAYYLARDRRDAASAIIDGWRTLCADNRGAGRVG